MWPRTDFEGLAWGCLEIVSLIHLCGPGVRGGGEVHDKLRVGIGKPSELGKDQDGFPGAAGSHDKRVPLRRPQGAEHERVPNLPK